MTVNFIHIADIHLGSPLRALEGASEEMATNLARAAETAFSRSVTEAIERNVDFIVVAGDLYDREARSVRANQFLVEQFQRLEQADIPGFVVHGNHDPLGRGAEKLDLPDNVHVFSTDEVGSEFYPDGDDAEAEILGRSYGSRHEGGNFIQEFTPEEAGIPSIGLLHTALDPDGREFVPCDEDDLASRDVDYWALGHVHHLRTLDSAPGAYPGIPQPRHAGEPPVGGCLVVELDGGNSPDIEFVPTSSVVWYPVEVDVSQFDSPDYDAEIANLTDLESHLVDRGLELQGYEIEDYVTHAIVVTDADWEPEGIVCRWTLSGRGDIYHVLADSDEGPELLAERVRDQLGGDDPFVWTESVKDRTKPPLPDREQLAEENEVIARFLDLVEDLRDDPNAREEMRGEAGDAWEQVEDPDRATTSLDRVPLTSDRFDDLITEASEIAVTRMAAERYDVD